MLHAGRSHYEKLLAGGVKIYELRGALLHAKTAVIDDVWSTVGSTNFDWRSFMHNDELNTIVLGEEFGRSMTAMFEADLRDATRVELERWRERPLATRLKERAARLFEYCKAGGGATARRNTKARTPRAVAALEDSRTRPSRRSTRRSANRARGATNLQKKAIARATSPQRRARQALARRKP